jgi:hypothetical protein
VCDGCKKERKLSTEINPEDLPHKWYCHMNTWDPLHNMCIIAQEKYKEIIDLCDSDEEDEQEEEEQAEEKEKEEKVQAVTKKRGRINIEDYYL